MSVLIIKIALLLYKYSYYSCEYRVLRMNGGVKELLCSLVARH